MMPPEWRAELERYQGFDKLGKLDWFAKFSFYLSLIGRSTYRPGTMDLDDPSKLRRINELLHRLAQHQLKILNPDLQQVPDEDFFEMVAISVNNINLNENFLLCNLRGVPYYGTL